MNQLIARIARRYHMTLDAVQRVCSDLLLVIRRDDASLFQRLATADPELGRLLETRTLRAYPRGRFGGASAEATDANGRPLAMNLLSLRRMLQLSGVPPRGIRRFVRDFVAWLGALFEDLDAAQITARSPSLGALVR